MKFEVVVGNPPYQETVRDASEGNNKNTRDVFQHFQDLALKIGVKNCLIYPAKEYQRGKKNVLNKHLISLRIYNGSSKETEKRIPGEPAVFGNAVRRIPGDVGIFYWDTTRETDEIEYQELLISRTEKILPVRKEFLPISKKLSSIAGEFNFSKIRKVCESNFVQYNPDSVLGEVKDRKIKPPMNYVKVLTNDKAGSGGKAKWYYIKKKDLDRIQPARIKVIINSAYPNEAFKNPDNVEIIAKDEMFGRSKKAIYDTDNQLKAEHFIKFLRTAFVNAIVEMTPDKFLYYLPNFDEIYSDIDWTKSISDIDQQLYDVYNFDPNDIDIIENMV
ncbi:MAG: Eco57I restriction-modification methylase domain-containing protein [Methanobrevibacter sp.]|jgi:hypothetical protein|nr:Eco57I restriction-modification methylase domain-containing protein [Candidatus Methanoflexus mossambicus]